MVARQPGQNGQAGPVWHCWQVLVVDPQVTEVEVCRHHWVEQVLVTPSQVTEFEVLLQVEVAFGPEQVSTCDEAEQTRGQGWKGGGHSISSEQALLQSCVALHDASDGERAPRPRSSTAAIPIARTSFLMISSIGVQS